MAGLPCLNWLGEEDFGPFNEGGEGDFGFGDFGVPAFFVLEEEPAVVAVFQEEFDGLGEGEVALAGVDIAPAGGVAFVHGLRMPGVEGGVFDVGVADACA